MPWGDEATVEFVNARGFQAKPVSEISLMDETPSYESEFSALQPRNTRESCITDSFSPNRQMKLLDFVFQLNETLIRRQAKCHNRSEMFYQRMSIMFSSPVPFSL